MQLLELPYEIRYQIYYQLLCNSSLKPNGLRPSYKSRSRGWKPPYVSGVDVSVIYTNHQIHDESTKVLYRKNRFVFFGLNVLIEFLSRIGTRNAALLAHIELFGSYYDTYNLTLAQGLWLAPSLRAVKIEACLTPCTESGSEACQLEFLKSITKALEAHPSLEVLLSNFPGGMSSSRPAGTLRAYLMVTLVANTERKRAYGVEVNAEEHIMMLSSRANDE